MKGAVVIRCSYFISIAILILFSGCARTVYIPASENVPMFDTNRQIKATGFVSTSSLQLQGAYNPVKHFSVATNIKAGNGVGMYDAAIGTYGFNHNINWRYELFGGYGYNYNYSNEGVFHLEKRRDYNIASEYNRYYIQPAFGYFHNLIGYNTHYSFVFSSRESYLHFSGYAYTSTRTSALGEPIVNKNYHNQDVFVFEPAITTKFGIKNINLLFQVESISPYAAGFDVVHSDFSHTILFSAGIEYNFVFRK